MKKGSNKKAKPFTRQIVVTFVAGFFVLVCSFTLYITKSEKDDLYQASLDNTIGLAQSLAVSSRSWILANDVVGLQEVILAAKNYRDLHFAMILSNTGRITAHTDVINQGLYISDEKSLTLLDAQAETQILRNNSDLVDVAVPVIFEGRQLGWVRVASLHSRENANLLMTIWRNIVLVLLATVLSFIAALLISKRLKSSIGELIDVAEQVRQGNLDARAHLPGRVKEVVILGDNLNQMLDALKQAQETIKESEQRYHFLFNNNPMPIFVFLEENHKIIEVNLRTVEHYGYSREEFSKMTIRDIRPKEGLAQLNQVQKRTPNGIATHETIHKKKDGTLMNVIISTMPMTYGGIAGRIVLVNDITERKKFELALTTEKERLAVTLRSIGDGVIATDTLGKIVMLNKSAEVLTGWDSEQAAGRTLDSVFNVENRNTQQKENPVEEVLSNGRNIEMRDQISLTRKDGKEIEISESAAPIHNDKKQIMGVVLVFRDMTEKKKLEESLQKAQRLESLGLLAGGIAHDFNNLLSGIFGFVEMASDVSKNEEVLSYLSDSLSSINRARSLTQQLLTFSKGGAPLKKVEPLFPFVQDTVKFALSGSSISYNFKIQEDLSQCNFDKNQIGQVIDNLIINAQQAMPNGGSVMITAKNISLAENENISLTAGEYVKLSIKDQGEGIPKELQTRIFDPYYTTKSKGQGLGLATCYSIIYRHGGCIELDSKPGQGSTFIIYLPASKESAPVKKEIPKSTHKGQGLFLVMDDEEPIRKIMKAILESFGYNVVLKENGEEAVEFVKKEVGAGRNFTGMVFDLTVPGGKGGKEAISEIRTILPYTPAFVSSGYSENPIMAEPAKYGFTASITKPFKASELSEMLEKHMNIQS